MSMKKKAMLLIAVILFSAAGLAQAQEGELHGVIDVTYVSSYIWRGFDLYPPDHSAIQPSIDVDLFGTGFGFKTWMTRANGRGFENSERWDYTLYYQNSLFADESYATNYRLGWVYYNYPDQPEKGSMTAPNAALQEIHAILSWPKIFPIEGLVPSYCLVKMWPSESNSYSGAKSPFGGTASGFAHIFMLDYGLPIPGLLPDTPEQTLRLHTEVIYNDGVGPAGQDVDHDWSNAVFGVATDFDLGNNLAFTPGVYYQSSWDDSVNPSDEYWVSLGMSYRF